MADDTMPPPQDTQTSLKRKRGRPPKTPTKGPAEKQIRASDARMHEDECAMDTLKEGIQVAYVHSGAACLLAPRTSVRTARYTRFLGYRTAEEVIDRDQWTADRASLFHEQEIARLWNDPLNETLTPAHVDTILQHVLLFHKRPLLLVSSANSAAFDTTFHELGANAGMSKAERNHLAMAAVPDLADELIFGETTTFEVVILPVYVPGHYVGRQCHTPRSTIILGARHLRRSWRVYSLLRQLACACRSHSRCCTSLSEGDCETPQRQAPPGRTRSPLRSSR
jgi:hypothetical protein